MRIFQHLKFLAGLFIAQRERHGVSSRRSQQRNTARIRRGPPAFRPHLDIRSIQRTRAQSDFLAALKSEIPPDAVDARLRFARRTTALSIFAATAARTARACSSPSSFF